MPAAYFRAAIPEPFRILGLRLKAFSLGHYLILKRFGCAFVSETDARATREDLVFGVLVCSMDHDEFLAFMDHAEFLKSIQKWGHEVGLFDLKEKALLFQRYIEEGTQQPKFWIEQDDNDPSGSHWSQVMITTLRGKLGYTRHEVLNAPLTRAFSDFYKFAEESGIVRIMTDEEIAKSGEREKAETLNGP